MWVTGTGHKYFSQRIVLSGEDRQEERGQATGRWFSGWNACCSIMKIWAQSPAPMLKLSRGPRIYYPSRGPVRSLKLTCQLVSSNHQVSGSMRDPDSKNNVESGREGTQHWLLTSTGTEHTSPTWICTWMQTCPRVYNPFMGETGVRRTYQVLSLRWILWISADGSTLCLRMSNLTPRRQQTRTQK